MTSVVAHRPDHRDLLRRVVVRRPRTVDAIVVPSGRGARHLATAVALADGLGSDLVALCDAGSPHLGELAALARSWSCPRRRVLAVPGGYRHRLLRMSTVRAEAAPDRLGLLGVKRNLGLLFGRLLGWRTMLFVDDDIVGLDPGSVRCAASGLDRLGAVGFAVADWPDNSVVCHANRLGGGHQEVFVGGSALLVDPTRPTGFFPAVYNEDWIYLYDWLRAGSVGRSSRVGQLPYDPFALRDRAGAEEFGEVLAEGLMDALHERLPVRGLADAEYWTGFLQRRRSFITLAAAALGVERAGIADGDRSTAQDSLAAAEDRRREITPASCAAYVRDWRNDLTRWHERTAELGRMASLDDAARFLDLVDVASLTTTPPEPVST